MEPKTREIIERFAQLNAIPRCSRKEQAVCDWLARWARDNGFALRSDAVGNMVIAVPASAGMGSQPVVVIQGHVDMVCEKRSDSPHDFDTDPIRHVIDGDWLGAADTSLGADNGIAVAIGMVLAESPDVPHPPLELLFTVDEETGLTGVKHLPDDLLTGRVLLNVDTETEGVFTIGCAGGRDATLTLPVARDAADDSWRAFGLVAGGMQGGHSGIDVGKHRANANKVMARCLDRIGRQAALRIVDLSGGTVHNAIPRQATARFLVPDDQVDTVKRLVQRLHSEIKAECAFGDPAFFLELTPAEAGPALSQVQSRQVTDFLMALPCGVDGMTPGLSDQVETSNNVAVVQLTADVLTVRSSQRSSVASRLGEICDRVAAVASLAGADLEWRNAYPPWTPDLDADLLRRCRRVYTQLFGREPEEQVLHAGLECAVIGGLYPGMQMISFGPTIENPHSPDERLHLPSVEAVWRFLVALMRSFQPPAAAGP
jgi:dipeptidase D